MYIGLDTETTGLDYEKHPVIQIGLFKGGDEPFAMDVGWRLYHYEEDALKINGFSHARIEAGAPYDVVDQAALKYLEDQPKRIIMVGWNVGNFDAPRVAKTLPGLFKRFHWQVIELNTAVIMASYATGIESKRIKDDANQYAVERIGKAPAWHDAGYDAQASLYAWQFLSELMQYVKKATTIELQTETI